MNFVDVKDCATVHVLAMEKGRSGERYILGGRNMELAEFFVKLEKDNFHKLALLAHPQFLLERSVFFT